MGVKSTEPGQPCPPDLLIPHCVAVHGWGQRGGRRDLRGMMGRGTEGAGTQGLYLRLTLGAHDLVHRTASCFSLPRPNAFHPWLSLGNQDRIYLTK